MEASCFPPMAAFPKAPGFDHTLAFLREGYRFVSRRCDRLGSDGFIARLMLRRVVCLRGAAAAELVYSPERVTRVGAMPITVVKLLQDFGSVQMLDDGAHRARKALFMRIGSVAESRRMAGIMAEEWSAYFRASASGDVVLLEAANTILTRAALRWVGIDSDNENAGRRCRELTAMFETPAMIGPRHWRAQILRRRAERWAQRVIRRARGDGFERGDGLLDAIVSHRNSGGELLAPDIAAIELLNVLRPTVAASRFIVFAAMALHEHPDWRQRFAAGDDSQLNAFVTEVRRLAPFFPVIGARARMAFDWRGHAFAAGDWMVLDLYGTNRDRRLWPDADAFRPERFATKAPGLYEFVPQGAGITEETHRCPGESIVTEIMMAAVRLLTRGMRYRLPEQDLSIDLARIPARPASGFRIGEACMKPDSTR